MRLWLTLRDAHSTRSLPRRSRIEDTNLYRLSADAAQIEFLLNVLAQVIAKLRRHVLRSERELQRFEYECVTSV